MCEQGTPTASARITALELGSGEVETLLYNAYGLRLSPPNDVVQGNDGTIWFTDATWGFLQGFRPPPDTRDRVYRYEPDTARLSVAAESLDERQRRHLRRRGPRAKPAQRPRRSASQSLWRARSAR